MKATTSGGERRTLTTKELERVFGVSAMTLYLWRQGTATKSKLRTAPKKRGERSVLFYEDDVRAWASRHEVALVVDPSRIKQAKPKVARKAVPRTTSARKVAA